jgi:hypothetical protein
MNMTINKKTTFRLALLLFMAVSAIQLTGCGPDEAPVGSTITIEALSTSPVTTQGTKSAPYRVTVTDPEGKRMNDIDVNLLGIFTCSTGTAGMCPVTMANSSGDTSAPLHATIKTDRWGEGEFEVSGPTGPLIAEISAPTGVTATPIFTGTGTMVDGSYHYIVSSTTLIGEAILLNTAPALISNATVSADSVQVSWSAVAGATGYNVYNQERGDVHFVASPSLSFIDDGTLGTVKAFPTAASNTSGGSSNRITGTIEASTGTARKSISVGF